METLGAIIAIGGGVGGMFLGVPIICFGVFGSPKNMTLADGILVFIIIMVFCFACIGIGIAIANQNK